MSNTQSSRRPAAPTRRCAHGRTVIVAVAAIVCCLVLAACGGDDDGGGGGGDGGVTASSAEDAFPVTIRSKHGSDTIKQKPARVVTLDNQAADDALALGVVPVATAKVAFVPGGMQAWTKAALKGKSTPQLIDVDSGIPFERIAGLRPDLILATNTYQLEEKGAYDRLHRIAPTVHFAKGSGADTWQEAMGRVGQALGQEDQARELVEEAERDLAAARERTPAFEGATVNFFNADPSGLYTINDKQDYAIRFLNDLGLQLPPKITSLKAEGGRAQVSSERYDLLDSDLLIGTALTPKALTTLERDKLFARLPVVREDGYVAFDIGPATSMAFPSLLSVRWATREVVPKLEQAIKARAAS